MRTVDDLIQEVRDQADEQNVTSLTPEKTLRLLNAGYRIANSVVARHYPDTLIGSSSLLLSSGATHDIPAAAWEDNVTHIDIAVTGVPPVPVTRRKYSERGQFASASSVAIPSDWCIEGHSIKFLQTPSSSYSATAYYVRRLDTLVEQQGRITEVGATYVSVDVIGDDISTASDAKASYINIVNWRTGEVKGTMQVSSTSGTRINLRSSPIRSTILGRTVTGSADIDDLDIEVDDYVCLVYGSCVPYFQDAIAGYLVEHALACLSRGGTGTADARLEEQIRGDYEKRLAGAWTGREGTDRVKNKSSQFPSRGRRWPNS